MRTWVLSIGVCAAWGCVGGAPSETSATESTAQAITAAPEEESGGHALPPVRPGWRASSHTTTGDHGAPTVPGAGTWTPVTNAPSTLAAGLMLLLTDGSVMVHDLANYGRDWWRLRPDASGSYVSGTWSALPQLPDDYAPLYFASAVLPDGRVIIMGGEYQNFEPVWQARGAIFDPVRETWTAVAPPPGWTTLGDAPSALLADNRYVVSDCCAMHMATLDPATLGWIPTSTRGKADRFAEEGWTLLPDGRLLTVDATNYDDPFHSEVYTPGVGAREGLWQSGGSTVAQLSDPGDSLEVGSAMLRPDGTVFHLGATNHTAIYDTRRQTWRAGPDLPTVPGEGPLRQVDGPAALLPDGRVLFVASPGVYETPAHYLVFDGRAITEVARPDTAQYDSSYYVNLLVLPTGEVMASDFSGDIEVYRAAPTRERCDDIAPEIEDGDLRQLRAGRTYRLRGTQLHGVSQAVAYGDDAQAATNYPLVRIRHRATGHVAFARTHSYSNSSIARGARSEASFDVPAGIETGDAELVVIANGVPSEPRRVTVLR